MWKKLSTVRFFILLFTMTFFVLCFLSTPFAQAADLESVYYTTLNPFYQIGAGLPNCTGYVWGRIYEVYGFAPNTSTGHASSFWDYNKNNNIYPYGQEPMVGAIACWSEGSYGYGHVAFVESYDGTNVTFSESNYGDSLHETVTLNKASVPSYTYGWQGYIYMLHRLDIISIRLRQEKIGYV